MDGEGTVRIVEAAPQPTAVIPAVTSWPEFASLWGQLLEEVWTEVRAADVRAGRNVMLYLDHRPSVEVGVELLGPFAPRGRIIASSLPGGPAATIVAPGPPTSHGLAAAHDEIRRWCDTHGRTRTGVRWEVYSHWSEDPSQMHTLIHYLLEPA